METAPAPLREKRCLPCEGGVAPLAMPDIERLMKDLVGWDVVDNVLHKTYSFHNYYETIAFVNAIAWVAHQEDHHPDLEVGYRTCRVRYSTHAIGGLSENDFICAAKVDALFPDADD